MLNKEETIKFIDLFAGLGGIRLGFEQALDELRYKHECVLTSEIKKTAVEALKKNFDKENLLGDICSINTNSIPDFHFLLAGFPCQAFSVAGKLRGFMDTRGTLFFEIERILKEKKPLGFILENVEGLVTHDRENRTDKMGRTLKTILHSLEDEYHVSYKVLDSQYFGVPQSRKRIYIVGSKKSRVSLDDFPVQQKFFGEIMEKSLPIVDTPMTQKLLKKYPAKELYGKAIKDKRGGKNNIHSWDIGLKGDISVEEIDLLNKLLKERRKKHWAEKIGIDWMDGMPLTKDQISTFFEHPNLEDMLEKLTKMKYLFFEHPKKRVAIKSGDNIVYERIPDTSKPKGYNIVTGKLSFEFSRFLSPDEVSPTLVAMDMNTIGVIDGKGVRHLSNKEGLRLFGYPDSYSLDIWENENDSQDKVYDLLGNSVCVPVIKAVAKRLIENS